MPIIEIGAENDQKDSELHGSNYWAIVESLLL